MSEPRTIEREEELKEFINETRGTAYHKRAIQWFQKNLGKVVTSKELARLPGQDNYPIQHSMRRIFELRDEKGYEIANWKDNDSTKRGLKVDEWVLLKKDPNPKKIRDRGVNKRIMYDVFARDNNQCQICGRTPDDDDPFREGHKIKLHVGHISSHKQKDGSIANVGKKLTKDDFITMCNVCNEGAKNKDIKIITPIDRIKSMDEKSQKEILEYLKKKFK